MAAFRIGQHNPASASPNSPLPNLSPDTLNETALSSITNVNVNVDTSNTITPSHTPARSQGSICRLIMEAWDSKSDQVKEGYRLGGENVHNRTRGRFSRPGSVYSQTNTSRGHGRCNLRRAAPASQEGLMTGGGILTNELNHLTTFDLNQPLSPLDGGEYEIEFGAAPNVELDINAPLPNEQPLLVSGWEVEVDVDIDPEQNRRQQLL